MKKTNQLIDRVAAIFVIYVLAFSESIILCSAGTRGFRVGAGYGADQDLTNPGSSGINGAPTGRTNPAEVPGGPGGRMFARRVSAPGCGCESFTLQRSREPWAAGLVAG